LSLGGGGEYKSNCTKLRSKKSVANQYTG
jgi:hypothetical protein